MNDLPGTPPELTDDQKERMRLAFTRLMEPTALEEFVQTWDPQNPSQSLESVGLTLEDVVVFNSYLNGIQARIWTDEKIPLKGWPI